MMTFQKLIFFASILYMIFPSTNTSCFAMEEGESESNNITIVKTTDDSEIVPESSIVKKRNNSKTSSRSKENVEDNIEVINPIIKDPKHKLRLRLNGLLQDIKESNEKDSLLLEDPSPVETALIVYRPVNSKNNFLWDDHILYLKTFDELFFKQGSSKKTKVLMFFGYLEGVFGPFGIGPLTMYLGENLIGFIPVAGSAANAVVGTNIGLSALPCAQQIADRMQIIGDTLFDRNGFSQSKDDKKPHVQKLNYEKETGNTKYCKYIPIPVPFLGRLFALTTSTIRTLPIVMLFWEAENEFPIFRAEFIGPLGLCIFEKTYKESLEFVTRLIHALKSKEVHVINEKKGVLINHLNKMKTWINASSSDLVVNKIYQLIEQELKSKKQAPSQALESSPEHILAFSTFLLRYAKVKSYEGLQVQLDEEVEKTAESLGQFKGENNKKTDEKYQSLQDLKSITKSIKAANIQEMANFVEDISKVPPKANNVAFLENLSVYTQGAATTGRFLVTLWAIEKVLKYAGVSPHPAFYAGCGVAVVELLFRSISEWYLQKDTFLSIRHFGSRNIDFWPIRGFAGIASTVCSSFFSFPVVGILFNVLGDSVPLHIKILMSAATAPSEFSSFFGFFKKKYDRLITRVVTIKIKTTRQKRTWLNDQLDRAEELIRQLDGPSTQQLYFLSQEAL